MLILQTDMFQRLFTRILSTSIANKISLLQILFILSIAIGIADTFIADNCYCRCFLKVSLASLEKSTSTAQFVFFKRSCDIPEVVMAMSSIFLNNVSIRNSNRTTEIDLNRTHISNMYQHCNSKQRT